MITHRRTLTLALCFQACNSGLLATTAFNSKRVTSMSLKISFSNLIDLVIFYEEYGFVPKAGHTDGPPGLIDEFVELVDMASEDMWDLVEFPMNIPLGDGDQMNGTAVVSCPAREFLSLKCEFDNWKGICLTDVPEAKLATAALRFHILCRLLSTF